ncbi:MAG TPA: AIR synthase-related protein [Solirubrobacteraceae bacterium]|nr:AIR synthase-related protein [Solirubrobacteraceae bacterium]
MSDESAYRRAGVDYDVLDAAKRAALAQALATSPLLERRGGRALDASRGQPAFVFSLGGLDLAFVVEGLGTKSIIARQYEELTGESRFDAVAYDTVAAIVNDLCCVGAAPLVVNAYYATGSGDWYAGERADRLRDGWRRACEAAGATWGGGESPTLPGLVDPAEIELAGAAVGLVPDGVEPILGQDLAPGDAIVFVESSGLHANGASLARKVASSLPDGLRAELPDGRRFGEALLDPSIVYAELVARVLAAGVHVSYLSHVTGHGLLKLMRTGSPLTYRVRELPEVPPVLAFLAAQAGMSDREAYTTLNMGIGFAVYCRPGGAAAVVAEAERLGMRAHVAGEVEEGPRRVVVEPIDVVLEGEEMVLHLEGEPT